MLGLATEDDYTRDDNISETEDNNGENKDEINEEEPYFNYNYSYDCIMKKFKRQTISQVMKEGL